MSPLRSSAGPAVWTNGDVELLGDDPRERGLARARAGRRAARGRAPRRAPRRPRSRPPSCSLSSCWPTNSSSRRGRSVRVELVVGAHARGLDAVGAGRADHRARGLQGVGDQVLRRVAGGAVEQRSISCGLKPSPSSRRGRAARGSSPRAIDDRVVGRARRPSRAARPRSARRCACRSGRRLQPAVSPAATAASSSRGGPPRSTASAIFGPDALDADQQQEQVALLLGREAVERHRVVADDQVGEQRDRACPPRDLAQRLGGDARAGSRRRRRTTTT